MNLDLTAIPSRIADRVEAAIGDAARRTGVDFGYLLDQAKTESGLNPAAKARTSSATGLFQFIDRTWLATVKQHGAKHGLGWAADAIDWAGGKLRVADAGVRQAILALRSDPAAASLMAAEHAADNAKRLEAKLGRAVGQVDLYLAHFLGAGGATRFLKSMAIDGSGSAAAAMPRAAAANRNVFYARDGSARSLDQVYARFAAKFGGDAPAPRSAVSPAPVMLAEASATRFTPAPAYARAAYLMLAQFGA